jgi:homopolymeric O-antigen transport system ATP-binding protein
MRDLSVKAVGLSKQYRIGQMHSAIDTLRDHLMHGLHTLRTGKTPREHIWALDDVSFEIAEGEVVGIIGRNGAGKTTLLRVLSRITEPTRGFVDVTGRVGSLLEVGTGFHAELTGRENIFLNGAILGMRRSEIVRKFDEIVEFSGVEQFLDTPVKRYSSGMFVRLAFSVAAHLEPEILIVDEVLAVGDAEFQKRCLGKMEAIGASGRTVIFVSHTMPTITRLCERALLLDGGRIVDDGPAEAVVARYLNSELGTTAWREWRDLRAAPGNDVVRLRSVRVIDSQFASVETVDVRDPVGIELSMEILVPTATFVPWIALYNERNEHVFSAMDTDPAWLQPRPPGRYTTTAWIPPNLLNEGTILVSPSLNTFVSGGRAIRNAHVDAAVSFRVVESADDGVGTARGGFAGHWPGSVRPLLEWTTHLETGEAVVATSSATRS